MLTLEVGLRDGEPLVLRSSEVGSLAEVRSFVRRALHHGHWDAAPDLPILLTHELLVGLGSMGQRWWLTLVVRPRRFRVYVCQREPAERNQSSLRLVGRLATSFGVTPGGPGGLEAWVAADLSQSLRHTWSEEAGLAGQLGP